MEEDYRHIGWLSFRVFPSLSGIVFLFALLINKLFNQKSMFMSTRFLLTAVLTVIPFAIYADGLPEKSLLNNEADTIAYSLREITVSSTIENSRISPLRVTSIDKEQIKMKSAGRTFPELLKEVPGVFATPESGSFADARINIRGFRQENISVLLNGIPISGLTSGSMFWNNWVGLTDATSTIRLQKGIGASMLSDNSVGGTINIVTKSPTDLRSLDVGYYYTDYQLSRGYFTYNSGETGNGWGFSLSGSYLWGHGYVEATDASAGAYMLSISKRIDNRHSLLFTALGGPECHQQRSQRLTYPEMERYGRGYNKNWGPYREEDGKTVQKNISVNNYFKPYFTINYLYTNKNNLKINSALYMAIGNGGGNRAESKGKKIISYQKEGHIDWDAVMADNRASAARGESAQNILGDYMAGHTQFGALTSLIWTPDSSLTLEGGLHYQLYNTWEKEKITDLLGGDFWYEDYEHNSLAGIDGRNPIKRVGDCIRTNNGKKHDYGTLYASMIYKKKKVVLNGGASLYGAVIKRWDKYNYKEGEQYSKTAVGTGGSIKGGILYKLDLKHSLYLNAAAYSRIPYSDVYFSSGNNSISGNIKNEKNLLGEFGYRFTHYRGAVEATLYGAYWFNKSLMSNPYKPLEEDARRYMVTGLDALHYGMEIEGHYLISTWAKLYANASFASWRWKNNVHATIYDDYSTQPIDNINVYSNGLPVGDAPQTQIGAAAEVTPFRHLISAAARQISKLTLSADWQYGNRYWAEFKPDSRTDPNDKANPYRIPAYHVVNLNLSNRFDFNAFDVTVFFSLNNLLDSKYIIRGADGADHTKESFTGYWGAPRNLVMGLSLHF